MTVLLWMAAMLLGLVAGYIMGLYSTQTAKAVQKEKVEASAVSRVPLDDLASVVAGLPQDPPAAVQPPAGAKPLIGKDLANWHSTRGEWRVDNGTLVNQPSPSSYARIETVDSYGDFKLTGQVLLDRARYGEIQLRGLTFGFEYPHTGTWSDLEILSQGGQVTVSLGGKPVKTEPADAKPAMASSAIAFYVMKGGLMRLKDLYIKAL